MFLYKFEDGFLYSDFHLRRLDRNFNTFTVMDMERNANAMSSKTTKIGKKKTSVFLLNSAKDNFQQLSNKVEENVKIRFQ